MNYKKIGVILLIIIAILAILYIFYTIFINPEGGIEETMSNIGFHFQSSRIILPINST